MTELPMIGTELPALELPPLSRATLALYAGGSADHVPLHIDSAYAQRAGYPDVFMHGMLGMAYVGRLLTQWMPQGSLAELRTRFVAITYPGEVLIATGRVAEHGTGGIAGRVRVEVRLRNAGGEPKLIGSALLDCG